MKALRFKPLGTSISCSRAQDWSAVLFCEENSFKKYFWTRSALSGFPLFRTDKIPYSMIFPGFFSKFPGILSLFLQYDFQVVSNMSHFAYACKTEGQNGISRLISGLCVNCLISIPEYSRLNHLDVHLV